MYVHRVHLEADQSVRSMKLPFDAYRTKNSSAVGAWVFYSRTTQSRLGVQSEGGGQNTNLGGAESGGERPAVSTRGRTLRPNVRNLDRVD